MPLIARLSGLCALILAATPALAADFDGPYPLPDPGYEGREPPPPPRPEPEFRGPPRVTAGPRFDRGPDAGTRDFGPGDVAPRDAGPPEACREFVRRRLDADGEPVLRRVRVCDEPAFERGPPPPPPPPEEIPPRHWGGPRG